MKVGDFVYNIHNSKKTSMEVVSIKKRLKYIGVKMFYYGSIKTVFFKKEQLRLVEMAFLSK